MQKRAAAEATANGKKGVTESCYDLNSHKEALLKTSEEGLTPTLKSLPAIDSGVQT